MKSMLRPFTSNSPIPDQPRNWDRNLGFGYQELDAFWLARWTPETGWQPGALYEHQGAVLELSPGANALHYGQALFEGLKARRTREGKVVLFRPIDNARRTRTSAARLVMQAPSVNDFVKGVESVVRANARWVPGYEKGSLYVRPTLIGSGPVLGVNPSSEYTFFIFTSPVGQYMGGGRLVVLTHAHRSAPYGTGAAKVAGNYAASLRPHRAAAELGYTDALYLDAREDCFIEEMGGANFFAILWDGTIVTPSLGSILPGITRGSLITIARELFGWIVIERPLSIEEVLNDAVEAFYTGTAAVLSSITTINYEGEEYEIGDGKPGKRAETLRQAINEIQLQERPDLWGWVTEVEL
jgi:branched-chain amino acid aminotransferase